MNDLLLDFQEAQCYVTLATEIAFCVALASDGDLFGSSNVFQAQLNVTFLGVVANLGSCCLSVHLSILKILDFLPPFINVMSFVVITTGTAISIAAAVKMDSDTYKLGRDLPTFSECGNRPPASIYCLLEPSVQTAAFRLQDTLQWTFLMAIYSFMYSLVLLLVDVLPFPDVTLDPMITLIALLPQLGFTGFFMWALIKFKLLELVSEEWDLAQIIAVTIWSAFAFRLIYFCIGTFFIHFPSGIHV